MSDLKAIWVEKKLDSSEPEALRIDFKDDWHVRIQFDSLSKKDIAHALHCAGHTISEHLYDESEDWIIKQKRRGESSEKVSS